MNKKIISASILNANLVDLATDIRLAIDAGIDSIHYDVMDGCYVPNISFGHELCRSLKNIFPDIAVDVHLMVDLVDNSIENFITTGADSIVFHPEMVKHLNRTISTVKDHGLKVGIALNPATSLSWLDFVWNDIDTILIMTVNPGFGGQKFLYSMLPKIQMVVNLIKDKNPNIILQVDGGINANNIKELATIGVDSFVVGSAIFKSADYYDTLKNLKNNINVMI